MNPIASYAEEDWDRLMDLMVKGPFLAMKFAWPHLTRQRGGRIIVTSSTLGLEAAPYKAACVAAKAIAVIGLMKVAALEGAMSGLTANAVLPGWMYTPIVEKQIQDHISLKGISREEVIASMVEEHPAKRFVETAEVASLVTFLASADASGINGACIPVDTGGLAV